MADQVNTAMKMPSQASVFIFTFMLIVGLPCGYEAYTGHMWVGRSASLMVFTNADGQYITTGAMQYRVGGGSQQQLQTLLSMCAYHDQLDVFVLGKTMDLCRR